MSLKCDLLQKLSIADYYLVALEFLPHQKNVHTSVTVDVVLEGIWRVDVVLYYFL